MRLRSKYILIDRIEEAEKMGNSNFEFSSVDSKAMVADRGIVVDKGPDVKGIEKGEICYYNKSRAFKLMVNGETNTVITEDLVILVLPSES